MHASLALKLLLVATGGAIGSVIRYLLESHINARVITAVINTLGSFLMGMFTGWLLASAMAQDKKMLLSALLMSGFCGGFSTFAHFATITMNYLRDGAIYAGIGYIFITIVAGLVFCFGGFLIGTRLV